MGFASKLHNNEPGIRFDMRGLSQAAGMTEVRHA